MRERSDLAIGVKAGQHGLFTHDTAYAFHFFLNALLENELSAHTADENSQFRSNGARLQTGPRRADGAVDQPVDICLGEPRMSPFGNISRERHAVPLLVDCQYCAHHWSLARLSPHTQRKQQAGGRQSFGMLAQVLFVKAESGPAIQLE